jgi:NADH-quinone oxidoreductase subunit M
MFILISYLIVPLITLIGLLFCTNNEDSGCVTARFGYFLASLVSFATTIMLAFVNLEQLIVTYNWLPEYGIKLVFKLDGVRLLFLILSGLFIPILIFVSPKINEKGSLILLTILDFAIRGTLLANDFISFYFFFELMVLPMYLIVKMWGRKESEKASMQFLLYTLIGAATMLVSIITIGIIHYKAFGNLAFDFDNIKNVNFSYSEQKLIVTGFLIAFAVKIPLFPFHTWLPKVLKESSCFGAIIFVAILFKIGLYGFFRIVIPFFPLGLTFWAPYLSLLVAIAILYGSLIAYRQDEIRLMLGYSTISHLAVCVLGLIIVNETAINGAIFHSFAHGISAGGLFLLIGMLEQRVALVGNSGLATRLPKLTGLFFILMLGYIAVPLTNGFIGEVSIIISTLSVYPLASVSVAFGMVLGAIYMLRAFQRLFLGEQVEIANSGVVDLNFKETMLILPLAILTLVLGIYPQIIFNLIETPVKFLVDSHTRENSNKNYNLGIITANQLFYSNQLFNTSSRFPKKQIIKSERS